MTGSLVMGQGRRVLATMPLHLQPPHLAFAGDGAPALLPLPASASSPGGSAGSRGRGGGGPPHGVGRRSAVVLASTVVRGRARVGGADAAAALVPDCRDGQAGAGVGGPAVAPQPPSPLDTEEAAISRRAPSVTARATATGASSGLAATATTTDLSAPDHTVMGASALAPAPPPAPASALAAAKQPGAARLHLLRKWAHSIWRPATAAGVAGVALGPVPPAPGVCASGDARPVSTRGPLWLWRLSPALPPALPAPATASSSHAGAQVQQAQARTAWSGGLDELPEVQPAAAALTLLSDLDHLSPFPLAPPLPLLPTLPLRPAAPPLPAQLPLPSAPHSHSSQSQPLPQPQQQARVQLPAVRVPSSLSQQGSSCAGEAVGIDAAAASAATAAWSMPSPTLAVSQGLLYHNLMLDLEGIGPFALLRRLAGALRRQVRRCQGVCEGCPTRAGEALAV